LRPSQEPGAPGILPLDKKRPDLRPAFLYARRGFSEE
jgi:hypothetical protein